MLVMAAHPTTRNARLASCRLVPFEATWAARLVSWVTSDQELYWLAPKTHPPLTPVSVVAWRGPDHSPYVLLPQAGADPVGYGELNRLTRGIRQYWLGHLVVDPARRGLGYGVELTRRLLREAFEERGAERVTLVVFPQNEAALKCYLSAGMRLDGHETHEFRLYGRRERLVRLVATRAERARFV
jgi:RimJ/RimL family protein N-acetyltransferase